MTTTKKPSGAMEGGLEKVHRQTKNLIVHEFGEWTTLRQ